MPKVEVHTATVFNCPRCQALNLRRNIQQSIDPDDPLHAAPAQGIPLDGSVGRARGWHHCRDCGYELTPLEREAACGFPAWFFICDYCGRENFLTPTICEFERISISPPEKFSCEHCRMPYTAISQHDDPEEEFLKNQKWFRRVAAASKELREKYGFDC